MAKILFYPAAEKDFRQLPVIAREEAENCMEQLSGNLYAGKPLHGPLRGYFVYPFHAAGIAYRIAYEIAHNNAAIIMLGSRDNFYKKFGRRIR